MDPFLNFMQPVPPSKCNTCPVKKSKGHEAVLKKESFIISKHGTGEDILILLEMPMPSVHMNILTNYLIGKAGMKNFSIAAGMQCMTKNFKIKSPIANTYTLCNMVNEDKLPFIPKVIIPIGRAVNSLTKTDDLTSAMDFREHLFNQTYFYTGYHWKNKIRCYPLPMMVDWINSSKNRFINDSTTLFVFDQIKKAMEYAENPSPLNFKPPILIELKTKDEANKFLNDNMHSREVAIDTETSSLFHYNNDFRVGCITLSFDGITGYFIDFKNIDVELFSQFLINKYQIYANGKFDVKALRRMHIKNAKVDEDVILLLHILNTERTKKSIKSLAWLLGFGGYDIDLDKYKKKYKPKTYLDIPKEVLLPYATLDPIVTFRLYQLGKSLSRKQPAVYELYKDTYIPVLEVFTDAEEEGMGIDISKMKEVQKVLETDIIEIENKLFEFFGEKFNLGSNELLADKIEALGFECFGRTIKGKYKVGKSELLEWQNSDNKNAYIITNILEHRQVTKLINSFSGKQKKDEGFFNMFDDIKEDIDTELPTIDLDSIDEEDSSEGGIAEYICADGKIHTTFGPAITRSGRASCIAGDSIINISGVLYLPTIKFLVENIHEYLGKYAWTHHGNLGKITNGFYNGKKEMLRINLLGHEKHLQCTFDHLIYTYDGWIKANELDIRHHKVHTSTGLKKIESIEYLIGLYDCYDLEIDHSDHSYEANGIKIHNCNWPNLQQVSKHSKYSKQFRTIFTPPKDYLIGEADYDGFQLRIGQILSGDAVMKDIFLNRGGDMHSITAQNFFYPDISIEQFLANKETDKEYKKARQIGKSLNFGFEFGRSAFAFAKDVKLYWSDEQIDNFISVNNLPLENDDRYLTVATELRRLFFELYTGLEQMILKQQIVSGQGYVDSHWGARRHLPYLTYIGSDSSSKRVKHLQNIAVNSPVQNFEAVVIYRAMIKIHKAIKDRKLKSKIVAMVHDSIVFYLHKDELFEMYQIIKNGMEDHTSFEIPLTCQLSIGNIWGFGDEVPNKGAEEFLRNYKAA